MIEGTRLVGRAAEVADLEAEWRRAAAGELRCVLLTGDAGVGKTSLANDVVARHAPGATILSARARPLGGVASFGLWAEALDTYLRELSPAEITELCGGPLDDLASLLRSVAAVRGATPDREPPRSRLLESLGTLLGNLARRRPVVAVLDDMHQADASSWDLLHYLALRFPGLRPWSWPPPAPVSWPTNPSPSGYCSSWSRKGRCAASTSNRSGRSRCGNWPRT